jgi:hypothetical protein
MSARRHITNRSPSTSPAAVGPCRAASERAGAQEQTPQIPADRNKDDKKIGMARSPKTPRIQLKLSNSACELTRLFAGFAPTVRLCFVSLTIAASGGSVWLVLTIRTSVCVVGPDHWLGL